MKEEKGSGVQSIDRAFQILEALSEHPRGCSVGELTEELQLNKSTTHRILQTLVAWGYAAQDDKTRIYRLGLKVVGLSSQYLNGLELKTEALPFLEALQRKTGVFAHLGILDGSDVVYLDKLGPYTHLRMYSQIGKRASLHATSLGKAMFLGMKPAQQQALLGQLEFSPMTEKTCKDQAAFLSDIEASRVRGYAVDDEENELGIRCAAAPIYDYTGNVIAAVSASGRVEDFPSHKLPEFGGYVQDCARQISVHMGCRDPR